MLEKVADTLAARQVEQAVLQLDSLSTLPAVAARFFPKLLQPQFSPSDLADIVESDPALTARILSIAGQQGLFPDSETPSVRRALDKIAAHLVRDAILSVRVFGTSDAETGPDNYRALPRKQLALHLLAVACCAKSIAEIVSPQVDPQLAYSAGLLHDIGKLALDQVMPKSFARIVVEAKSKNASACATEQKQLGLDHTILGKRLAQRWHLPNQITLAIWLHHSNTASIAQSMPQAKIAQVVQLADLIARQCGIGQSGSYDTPDLPDATAKSLGISNEQMKKIRQNLTEQVSQKSKLLGLDSPTVAAAYGDAVHTTVSQLAQNNTKLSLENRRLQIHSGHFDFIKEFLTSIDSATAPLDAAEKFAVRWQKFYQTGKVCLYLTPPADSEDIEAVIVENLSQSRVVYVKATPDSAVIPEKVRSSFAILDANEYADWLFEQLDVEFDPNHTKLVPILYQGNAIGAIVFELRYPGDAELFEENFKATTSLAGVVLGLASASSDRQRFAEQFVQLIGSPKAVQETPAPEQKPAVTETGLLEALSEMAAGAAHELNNPLSVISGRAQLLADSETDAEKKRILKQIRQNAGDMAGIVDDLMNFAKPTQPRPASTGINQILEEAIELTTRRRDVERIEVQTEIAADAKNAFVDSAQIASAIANIFSNSLESYPGELGLIKVTAGPDESGDFLKLQIADTGCGMDEETLRKATQPFFSAKPAGRKRGMGLALAQRIIQSNGGSLDITSQPGKGTAVTILLPCK